MTELLLVRHGETDWNRDGRFQGHADPPLNETGRAQALALAQELASDGIDVVYSSDLARARETAEIVASHVGADVIALRELREVDVGEWQGLTWPEIEQRYPEGARVWRDGGHGWKHGESYEDLGRRIVAALGEIAAVHPGRRVLVVGHGGTVRAVKAFIEGVSVADSRRRSGPIGNCHVYRVVAESGGFRGID